MELRFKRNFLSLAIAGSLSMGAPYLLAQENTDAEGEAVSDTGSLEEVVVTGSRISRPGAVSPTPVTSLTAEEISLSGNVNLGDFLNDMPALRSTFSGNNSGRFIGTVGLNLLDLRGLGEERTLVLQDGRRHIAARIGTSAVDVNNIPEDLIERVDVITGGASAVYGADAVTGVVNFILKDDFEGAKLSAYGSAADNGGGDTTEVSFTFGTNLFEGRANIAGNIQRTDRDETFGYQRDWIKKAYGTLSNPVDTGPADGIPDRILVEDYRIPFISDSGIAFLPMGDYTFNDDGTARPVIPGSYCGNDGRCTGGDGYAFTGQYQMYPRMETTNFFVKGHYDVSDSMRVFAEAKYVQNEAQSYDQSTFSFDMHSVDNPFLDPSLAADLRAQGVDTFGMYRMHSDLGYRGDLAERDTQRYVLGVKGDFGNSWNYEASLVYGQYDGNIYFQNNLHEGRYAQAINAVELDGQIVCADADARADGCAPLDLFGFGRASQEAIDYVMLQNTGSDEQMTQSVFSAFVSGDLLELPAGALQVAGGVEYREETSEVDYSEIIKAGETFMNELAPAKGEYDVSEVFVEASAPLLSDIPGIQSLTFDTAYRASDYSTVGNTGAWKAGFDWTVVDDVRVRATASQAVRAPNIDELFAPLGQNFFSIDDPCDHREIDFGPNPEQRRANCAALGITQPFESVWYGQTTLPGFSGGNANLQEETADTVTYGIVFTPRFVEGLTVTVDYWDMEIEDAISYYDGQTVLDKCVDGASIENAFCANIERDAAGQLVSLTSQALNASALTARGIDYEVRYEMALNDLFNMESLGSLTLSLVGTHLLERDDFSFQDDPGSADREDGEVGDPEHNFVSNVTYRYGNLSVNWRHEFLDDMVQYELEDERPESVAISTTGRVRYNDLQVRYLTEQSLEIFGGVNNIEDTEPPAPLTGIGGDSGIYDTLGRTYYLGANYTF